MQHVRFPLIPGNILLDEVLTNKCFDIRESSSDENGEGRTVVSQ